MALGPKKLSSKKPISGIESWIKDVWLCVFPAVDFMSKELHISQEWL
jgi:hypothetical protein